MVKGTVPWDFDGKDKGQKSLQAVPLWYVGPRIRVFEIISITMVGPVREEGGLG